MNNNPIGVLDSGIGGLSIWREIVRQLPNESTIYLADSKNCPYGTKSAEEIYSLARRLIVFLVKKRCKLIVVACNTITVTCLDRLRKEFPSMPIVGTVPVVKTAAEVTKNGRIGIFSTSITAKSHYQKQLIKQFASECEVIVVGTDRLVPLVEQGSLEGRTLELIVTKELFPFRKAKVDTVALGCSHFPFIKPQIQEILGPHVKILDSAGAIARQTRRILENNDILSRNNQASHEFYTTGNKEQFGKIVGEFTKEVGTIDRIKKIDI